MICSVEDKGMDWGPCIERLKSVRTNRELCVELAAASTAMGFSYYSLIQRSDSGLAFDGVQLSNVPKEWQDSLADACYHIHDPVLERSARRCSPFWWNEVEPQSCHSRSQKRLMEEAAGFGLVNGLSIPLFVPGEPAGLASFGVMRGMKSPYHMSPVAQYIATFGFEAGRRIERQRGTGCAELDDLARYVITMLGRGRSAAVIANVAGEPRETINRIIEDAKRHYRVHSTTQIVVHALRAGKIGFHDLIDRSVEPPPFGKRESTRDHQIRKKEAR